jgi:hypothetical protein
MPASRESIDMLFVRLAAAYTTQWLAKFDGMDMDKVKSVWADDLDGMTVRRVKYGLANLPSDFPPNSMQFRDLCRRCPDAPVVMLPAPKPDIKRMAEAIAKMNEPSAEMMAISPGRRWAWLRRDCELHRGGILPSGRKMTAEECDDWRKALGHGKYAPGAQKESE